MDRAQYTSEFKNLNREFDSGEDDDDNSMESGSVVSEHSSSASDQDRVRHVILVRDYSDATQRIRPLGTRTRAVKSNVLDGMHETVFQCFEYPHGVYVENGRPLPDHPLSNVYWTRADIRRHIEEQRNPAANGVPADPYTYVIPDSEEDDENLDYEYSGNESEDDSKDYDDGMDGDDNDVDDDGSYDQDGEYDPSGELESEDNASEDEEDSVCEEDTDESDSNSNECEYDDTKCVDATMRGNGQQPRPSKLKSKGKDFDSKEIREMLRYSKQIHDSLKREKRNKERYARSKMYHDNFAALVSEMEERQSRLPFAFKYDSNFLSVSDASQQSGEVVAWHKRAGKRRDRAQDVRVVMTGMQALIVYPGAQQNIKISRENVIPSLVKYFTGSQHIDASTGSSSATAVAAAAVAPHFSATGASSMQME